ncbi:MAG: CheB methylesterase domain-containing protein [Oscillospiraceae bacterium]
MKHIVVAEPVPIVVTRSKPAYVLNAPTFTADYAQVPDSPLCYIKRMFFQTLEQLIKTASIAVSKLSLAVRPKPPLTPEESQAKASSAVAAASAAAAAAAAALSSPISGNFTFSNPRTVIAIGASTGGTEAIIQVVKDLPATTPPVIIVQHMPTTFTKLYAERLNTICKMKVKEAKDMDRVVSGQIIIAEGGFHMTLKRDETGYYIRSMPGERVSGHCPSVDVMFNSVAELVGKNAVGVLLTGMGSDGARGLTNMRKHGAYTIGQDKESCVVYGMPMEAFKRGGVSKQLPLTQITAEILRYLSKSS